MEAMELGTVIRFSGREDRHRHEGHRDDRDRLGPRGEEDQSLRDLRDGEDHRDALAPWDLDDDVEDHIPSPSHRKEAEAGNKVD
jgi:hypothetical protein